MMTRYLLSTCILALYFCASACSKRNPDACCETADSCAARGFDEISPCALGVCVDGACIKEPNVCDGDEDCRDGTYCVDRSCAGCRDNTTCAATAPVCDSQAHTCRACAKDSECDSMACDLAIGACVEQARILYAAPGGATAEACTRTHPCSLRKAAESVDQAHDYIVLLPGNHSSGALFDGKRATIVGGGATLELVDGNFSLIHIQASTITMRDVSLVDHLSYDTSDHAAISSFKSSLTLENFAATTQNLESLYADGVLTIRRSTFDNSMWRNVSPVVSGRLIADQCTFIGRGAAIEGASLITNSIFDISPNMLALGFTERSGGPVGNDIINNTIIGGNIYCPDTPTSYWRFNSNIIQTSDTIQAPSACQYEYTLTNGTAVPGGSNIAGDPHFKDAAHGDFTLLSGSPAIDTADPIGLSNSHDFYGTPRPQGARADIGAVESH